MYTSIVNFEMLELSALKNSLTMEEAQQQLKELEQKVNLIIYEVLISLSVHLVF